MTKKDIKMTRVQTNKFFDIVDAEYTNEKGLSSKTISMIIEDHEYENSRIVRRNRRYENKRGNGVPIFERDLVINNVNYSKKDTAKRTDIRINVDYFSKIVDVKRGFMFGLPVTYSVDEENVDNFEKKNDEIKKFNLINNVPNKDSETGKIAGIAGYAVRQIYTDTAAQSVKIKNLDPSEVIFIDSAKRNIIDAKYALRHYNCVGKYKKKVEFYTPDKIIVYGKTKDRKVGTQSVTAEYEFISEVPNIFIAQPIIGYPNNGELMGDSDRVLAIIDALDNLMSDAHSEIAAFRLAYLIAVNLKFDEEDREKLLQSGLIQVGENGKLEWLIKDINFDGIIQMYNLSHKLIYEMSNTVDLSSEAFSGNQTKAAVQQKLLDFITKCSNTWRYFEESNRQMFKLLFSFWSFEKGSDKIDESYLYINQSYNQNFPENIEAEAKTAQSLLGIVSKRTIREKILSFIDDLEEEEIRLKAEEEMNNALNFDKLTEDDNDKIDNNRTE